ncbi:AraC family transcriptional regulator [Halobacillus andaensis]|uniref:AraC family transcriptional regulator n=1 Tax=Halobacillus andaensis TaxID=1176239 RepID=UPI003D741C3D
MQIRDFQLDRRLKELTNHRTVELPAACYETTISNNVNGYIPLHWHEEIQLIYVTSGEGTFQINEEKIAVKEGEGLFINSSRLHMAEESRQNGCVYICLNIAPHFLLPDELYPTYVFPYIKATNLNYLFIGTKHPWQNNILNSILNIQLLMQEEPAHFELDVFMLINQMWKELILNGLPLEYDEGEAIKQSRIKQMINYINLHYDKKIMLDDIAQAGQLSRSECCRYFKKMLGKTALDYVTDYRIQKSLVLLQKSNYTMTEIAYEVGFNSSSYFINKFRKRMNMTPLAYRKKLLGS